MVFLEDNWQIQWNLQILRVLVIDYEKSFFSLGISNRKIVQ